MSKKTIRYFYLNGDNPVGKIVKRHDTHNVFLLPYTESISTAITMAYTLSRVEKLSAVKCRIPNTRKSVNVMPTSDMDILVRIANQKAGYQL